MKKWVQTEWIWVSLILILGFLLRFYHLDFQSPWVDEIFTLKNASTDNTFKSIFELTQVQDKHPPLYYLSVHAIFEIFGEGIFIARMFSVVIGLLGTLAVYFLAKEMVSKNFAWIPTLFCAVNYFHIEHSQEARMYNLLFLFAVVSMLFLIKFIKKPDYKSAIWYGVSVGFFINVHFFSLFVLFAQGLILLIYILKSSNRKDGLKLFKLSALAYSLSLIMYIPSIMVLLHVSETKEFWIKKPEWDTFIYMVNVFFGKSEILLTLIGFISLLSIYYLIKYKKNFQIKGVPLVVILILWIFVPFLLALIYSLWKIPIIEPRYFISLLPGILILISIGFYGIKNLYVRNSLIFAFAIFSVYVLIYERNYYQKISKTQFREAAHYIESRSDEAIVVSDRAWFMKYFMDENKHQFIEKDLDSYVKSMMKQGDNLRNFWYFDAHNRTYEPNESTENYLDSLYIIAHEIDLHDAYVKNFIYIEDYLDNLDFSDIDISKNHFGSSLKSHIEKLAIENQLLTLKGWAIMENEDSFQSEILVIFRQNNEIKKVIRPKIRIRRDVTQYFKSPINLDYSGIEIQSNISDLDSGEYEVFVHIKNLEKTGWANTYQKLTIL